MTVLSTNIPILQLNNVNYVKKIVLNAITFKVVSNVKILSICHNFPKLIKFVKNAINIVKNALTLIIVWDKFHINQFMQKNPF